MHTYCFKIYYIVMNMKTLWPWYIHTTYTTHIHTHTTCMHAYTYTTHMHIIPIYIPHLHTHTHIHTTHDCTDIYMYTRHNMHTHTQDIKFRVQKWMHMFLLNWFMTRMLIEDRMVFLANGTGIQLCSLMSKCKFGPLFQCIYKIQLKTDKTHRYKI